MTSRVVGWLQVWHAAFALWAVLLLYLFTMHIVSVSITIAPNVTSQRHLTRRSVRQKRAVDESDGKQANSPSSGATPTTEFKVPNIVHYTWFTKSANKPFQFHHMLSVLSVDKYLKPDAIYFHTNQPPTGEYWNRSTGAQNFHVIHRQPNYTVWGARIKGAKFETSISNVERLKIVTEYGGIYMDLDYIALKSFDPLRKYACTLGYESDANKVCGGLIICTRESPFLALWLNAFVDDYRAGVWAYNTGEVPARLARKYPQLVHIEERSLHRPNYKHDELGQLLARSTWWNRDDSYGVHLWYRLWKKYLRSNNLSFASIHADFNSIRTLDNPYGEIARTVLFGSANP